MIPVSRAREIIMGSVAPGGTEVVPLGEALGRVLAEEVVAVRDSPPLDNSAMDGFALASASAQGASADKPARLVVAGVVKAGDPPGRLPQGKAVRIMTGAPLPEGADCMVPFEDARTEGELLLLDRSPRAGQHLRRAGEDIRAGETVLGPGRLLRPADLGLAASQGVPRLRVHRRPEVALLATGDEVVDLGQVPREGQIFSSNSHTLDALVRECGGLPRQMGIARDERGHLAGMVREALSSDVLVTTGGISMGDYDYLEEVLREAGVEVLFSKVAQKPGKPMTFGLFQGRPVFALPGNPVSTALAFELYVRPALRLMMGHRRHFRPVVRVVLDAPVRKKRGRTNFIRACVRYEDGAFRAVTTGDQGSGILRSMSLANAVLVLPEETEGAEAGALVDAYLLDAEDALSLAE